MKTEKKNWLGNRINRGAERYGTKRENKEEESTLMAEYKKWCREEGQHPWASSVLRLFIKETNRTQEDYNQLAKEAHF